MLPYGITKPQWAKEEALVWKDRESLLSEAEKGQSVLLTFVNVGHSVEGYARPSAEWHPN